MCLIQIWDRNPPTTQVGFALSQRPIEDDMPAAHVTIATTVGQMTLELDADNAPKTVENFLAYASVFREIS